MGPAWTAQATLPGGDFEHGDFPAFALAMRRRWPFLAARAALRLGRAYGTRVERILGRSRSMTDLGRDFGCDFTEAELDYLVRYEWARTAADVLWRRSKLGLQAPDMSADAVASYLNSKHGLMGDQWISSPHF
jgi:glycerol-3-phosphate dehydrogenase